MQTLDIVPDEKAKQKAGDGTKRTTIEGHPMNQKVIQEFTSAVERLQAAAESLEKAAANRQFAQLRESVDRLAEQVRQAQIGEVIC